MSGWRGLPCSPPAPRIFAAASDVPPSNKAAATTVRADLVMLLSPSRIRLVPIAERLPNPLRSRPVLSKNTVAPRNLVMLAWLACCALRLLLAPSCRAGRRQLRQFSGVKQPRLRLGGVAAYDPQPR